MYLGAMDNLEKEYFSQVLHKAQALKTVLEAEFEALKQQDLSNFDTLQQQKLDILTFLGDQDLFERVKQYSEDPQAASNTLELWDDVMGLITTCKDLHRRNEVLITRKLDAIRGALQTIQSPDPQSSVEVYDRLGKLRSNRSRQTMGDA